ncbi:uncharacterized protein LOC125503288, partial [Dendroctonus ponderosae]|uniref:uncharacterized protein LOC125503288 n=1 Tax=Dendroctonus ponderosae TaxID=77166 RepID=UPI0020358613
NSIKTLANKLIKQIANTTDYNQEYRNSFLPLLNLEKRIETSLNQINPIDYTQRQKRGIIDPLGSIIKCITGNLDQTDADKFDKQIKQLQENQNKLKESSINQITLLQNTIQKFNGLISNISANQLVLKSRILQIQQTVIDVALHANSDSQYFRTHVIINQISMIYQTIFDILEATEVAISFAKLNVLHNSIINPSELIKEIEQLKTQLQIESLPIETKIENILTFERIMNIKSYSKGLVVTFILEIPLVEPKIYHYYQLYPVPIPRNQSNVFYINFPHKPYLAISDTKYSYMDQVCQEISQNQYM